ncbi:Piso0_005818 [Millerozyma farinosa CBS 7064]|uniref:Piso0_005818 protein n=1 Tax=Pichia sorbitophila (strain ATCC MYA-4447 / BCRC 22081 / CBS 7064 / NBRC 10061 / NRRL Y-12695) TaxID=559304 RepID=G8Y302_PICSO|nr:Piso0_005818 [Millerozyma farinosa CBS 7064]
MGNSEEKCPSKDVPVFNEHDKAFVKKISETISALVPQWFSQSVSIGMSPRSLQLETYPVHRLSADLLEQCLNLVVENLQDFYCRLEGVNWTHKKRKEMKEEGLIYVTYGDQSRIWAFMSFMLTVENGIKSLYLYEIHVHSSLHSYRLGSELLDGLHSTAAKLNSLAASDQNYASLSNTGVNLTVFVENHKALSWYTRHGYRLSEHSPRDKKLRSRIIKPDYYILYRPNA